MVIPTATTIARARGEATRGEGERQASEREQLRFEAGGASMLHAREQLTRSLDRGDPTARSARGDTGERGAGVDIDMRSDHERALRLRGDAHSGHVVCLDRKALLVDQAPEHAKIRLGFEERERGDHDFLARCRKRFGDVQPVFRA